ncbi:MAG: HEPN domain-containing protein [Pyrinomonadaceae bacterium]
MKPLTREWVEKAEADFATARREVRVRKQPNYDGVCFHCQQCVEKYLKARLQQDRTVFRKTHDLRALLDLLLPSYQTWNVLRPDLLTLNNFAIAYRYPGESSDVKTARDALERCKHIREVVRKSPGLRS